MEAYKGKLKIRVGALVVILIAMTVVDGYFVFFVTGLKSVSDFIAGFQSGLFGVFVVMMVITLVRSFIALKSESNLKKLYIKEHD